MTAGVCMNAASSQQSYQRTCPQENVPQHCGQLHKVTASKQRIHICVCKEHLSAVWEVCFQGESAAVTCFALRQASPKQLISVPQDVCAEVRVQGSM